MNAQKPWSTGISPLIASVLLIAFTMTVAMTVGPFFTDTLKSTQDGTTEKTKKVTTAANLRLRIHSVKYNRATSNLTVSIQNKGGQAVNDISLTVFGDKIYHKTYNRSLNEKEVDNFEIEAGDHWKLRSIKASLNNYSVSTERELNGRPAEQELVGYWAMDEGQSIFINDSISGSYGKLYNGSNTCYGGVCPDWVSGKYLTSIGYDGINDDVRVQADSGELDVSNELRTDFSVTFQFKTSCSDCGLYHVSGDKEVCNNGHDRHIYLQNGNIKQRVWNGETISSSGKNFSDGKWHHVVQRVKKNTGQAIFVDGVKVASGNKDESDFDWAEYIHIGASCDAGKTYLNGKIDEVRIWNTALSSNRIKDPVTLE